MLLYIVNIALKLDLKKIVNQIEINIEKSQLDFSWNRSALACIYPVNHASQFTLQPITASDVANALQTIDLRKSTF